MVGQQQAITIARQRVVNDAVMTLTGRADVARDEGAVWHVSFPVTDLEVMAGAPHVLVDKIDGTLVEVYYTQ